MFNEYYEFNVYSIKFDGALTIDYKYSPLNGNEKRLRIKTTERPHEDWLKAWYAMKELFADLWGMPLVDAVTGEKLEWYIKNVKFLNKDKYGQGVKLTAAVRGIDNIADEIVLATQGFYETAQEVKFVQTEIGKCEVRVQELTPRQLEKLETLKRETFEFIHMGKKEQPTLEEAAKFIEGGAQ